MLGYHYDPLKKRLCLSTDVYHNPSVAALGIAAHESGHAIQHARGYAPLHLRMAVVPATQFVSQLLPFLLIGSLVIPLIPFAFAIKIAAWCYVVIAAFQLITLPVEFDASRRAKIILQEMGIIHPGEEAVGVSRVLDAAALTYVAAFVSAVGQMAYYFLLARSRD
jgi:Zn-dependent membrane protease YugP